MLHIWQVEQYVFLQIIKMLENEDYKLLSQLLMKNGFIYNEKKKWYQGHTFLLESNFKDKLNEIIPTNFHILKEEITVKDVIQTFDIKYDTNLLMSPPKNRLQSRAIHEAIKYEGVMLYERMGVGKTYISISSWNHFEHHNIVNKMIVVTISATLYNWKIELLKFAKDCKEEDIYVVTPKNREPFETDCKYVLMTYDGLRMILKDKKKNISSKTRVIHELDNLLKDKKIMLIADEIFNINHPKAIQSVGTKILAEYATIKMGLTATPIRKQWVEKYQHMSFISAGLVFNLNFSKFIHVVARTMGYYSNRIEELLSEQVEKWEKFWSPLQITGDLEIKAHNYIKVIWVEMDEEYKRLYERLSVQKVTDIIEECGYLDSSKSLGFFVHLLMSLSDMSLVSHVFEEAKNWKVKNNPKYGIVKDLLKYHIQDKKEKVVLWQNNPKFLDTLMKEFVKYDPLLIHGQLGLKKDEVHDMITRFNMTSDNRMIIGNPDCIGVGQNIQGANISITWGMDFDFVKFDQKTGRIYREGQNKDCTQYIIMFKGTIEESAWWTIQNRAKLNDLKLKYKAFTKNQIRSILCGDIKNVFESFDKKRIML